MFSFDQTDIIIKYVRNMWDFVFTYGFQNKNHDLNKFCMGLCGVYAWGEFDSYVFVSSVGLCSSVVFPCVDHG